MIDFILRFPGWDFSYKLCSQFSCDAEKPEKKFILRKMDTFLVVTFQVDLWLVWCPKNRDPEQLISSAQELSEDDDGKQAVIWFWFSNVRLFLVLDAGIYLLMRLWTTSFQCWQFAFWATFSCGSQFHEIKNIWKRRMWKFISCVSVFWNNIEDCMYWTD